MPFWTSPKDFLVHCVRASKAFFGLCKLRKALAWTAYLLIFLITLRSHPPPPPPPSRLILASAAQDNNDTFPFLSGQ